MGNVDGLRKVLGFVEKATDLAVAGQDFLDGAEKFLDSLEIALQAKVDEVKSFTSTGVGDATTKEYVETLDPWGDGEPEPTRAEKIKRIQNYMTENHGTTTGFWFDGRDKVLNDDNINMTYEWVVRHEAAENSAREGAEQAKKAERAEKVKTIREWLCDQGIFSGVWFGDTDGFNDKTVDLCYNSALRYFENKKAAKDKLDRSVSGDRFGPIDNQEW